MNDTRNNRRRLCAELLETRICLAADPAVIPVHADAFGTSYGELGGEWWNWIAKEPLATNPGLGGPCEANQSGKVWFLANSFGGNLNATCTIPTGKAIFLPVLANVSLALAEGPGDFPELEDDLRAEANAAIDAVASVNATLDGVEINAWNYRAESPDGGFTFSIPVDSIFTEPGFDAVPGDYSPAVVDGYWLLLEPLSQGAHTISYGGELVIDGEVVFAAQANFELEIVGGEQNDAAKVLAELGPAIQVGLQDGAGAFADGADPASRIVEPLVSVPDTDPVTPRSTDENTIAGGQERGGDHYESRMSKNASADFDELLSLLAEEWQDVPQLGQT